MYCLFVCLCILLHSIKANNILNQCQTSNSYSVIYGLNGTNVEFRCDTTNHMQTQSPDYSWILTNADGTSLSIVQPSNESFMFSGVNLKICSVSREDEGQYVCSFNVNGNPSRSNGNPPHPCVILLDALDLASSTVEFQNNGTVMEGTSVNLTMKLNYTKLGITGQILPIAHIFIVLNGEIVVRCNPESVLTTERNSNNIVNCMRNEDMYSVTLPVNNFNMEIYPNVTTGMTTGSYTVRFLADGSSLSTVTSGSTSFAFSTTTWTSLLPPLTVIVPSTTPTPTPSDITTSSTPSLYSSPLIVTTSSIIIPTTTTTTTTTTTSTTPEMSTMSLSPSSSSSSSTPTVNITDNPTDGTVVIAASVASAVVIAIIIIISIIIVVMVILRAYASGLYLRRSHKLSGEDNVTHISNIGNDYNNVVLSDVNNSTKSDI